MWQSCWLTAVEVSATGGFCPLGLCASPRAAILVVLTRVTGSADRDHWTSVVRRYTQAPLITARHMPVELLAATGERAGLGALRGLRVAAFCGIAQPDSFFDLLQQVGAHLACRVVFPDHYQYSAGDLAALTRSAKECGAQWLVTTEKDLVRLRGQQCPLPLWSLRITLQVDAPEALLTALTSKGLP